MSIRVLVADDHEMVRRGVATLLESSGVEVIGEASTGNEAVEAAGKLHPDVVLMDIRMENGDGIRALSQIKAQQPDLPVVMLSMYDNPTYVARSVTAGAVDYVLKGSSREQLVSAVKRAAEGKTPSDDSVLEKVRSKMASRSERLEQKEFNLTHREFQVLRHIALGLSNREIAESLEISVETVKEHVQSILRKTRASDRTQAAVWAVREGFV